MNQPENQSKETFLFISPHFDDAVLSCSGLLAESRGMGTRSVIVTIFSEGGDDPAETTYYLDRRQENERALSLLHCEWIDLGFLDAPYRNPVYKPYSNITGRQEVSDDIVAARIACAIEALCTQIQPDQLFLPLGIGEHIDHRLAFKAWPRLLVDNSVVFYEDRPYVFLPGMFELRKKLIGAIAGGGDEGAVALASDETAVRSSLQKLIGNFESVTIYRKSLEDPVQRFRWLLNMARKAHDKSLPDSLVLEPHLFIAEKSTFKLVEKAVSMYETQIPGLFETMANFVEASLEYSLRLGLDGYAERYWTPVRFREANLSPERLADSQQQNCRPVFNSIHNA